MGEFQSIAGGLGTNCRKVQVLADESGASRAEIGDRWGKSGGVGGYDAPAGLPDRGENGKGEAEIGCQSPAWCGPHGWAVAPS